MIDDAAIDGIRLRVISGYRSYYDQKVIWYRKWQNSGDDSNIEKGRKTMLNRAMPKTSRHHWGNNLDLNAREYSFLIQKVD